MQRKPVVSSNVKSIGYDPETKVLEVEFNGRAVYQYFDVPSEVHENIVNSPSVGSAISQVVKGAYKVAKMPV